jgi:hypothetical protein
LGIVLVISSSTGYVKSLEEKFVGLSVPSYKLRKWFDKDKLIFFDCEKGDKSACLSHLLEKTNIPYFAVFFIVKENVTYSFMDVKYRNLGKETLEHFIKRYEQQLKSMTKMSLQPRKMEYVELVGFSYEL